MTKPNPTLDLSVVILNWNTRQFLEDCLDSMPASCVSHSWEVIVVDNNSTDGSQEMIRRKFPGVKLICNSTNVGFPHGNNQGIKASSGRYISVVNSDVKFLSGCHDKLIEFMDANPRIGIGGPRVLNGDMTHQSSCRRFPSLWNNVCDAFALRRLFPNSPFFAGEHMTYFNGKNTEDVDVLVGCFWLVRRAAIEQFGLLDEGFFIYAEDVDWCKRCWKAGWRVVFFSGAEAIHYRGAGTTKKDPLRFALTQQRSILRYWKKHHGVAGRAAISCLIFCHLVTRWVAALACCLKEPAKREDVKLRAQICGVCLRDLFSGAVKV